MTNDKLEVISLVDWLTLYLGNYPNGKQPKLTKKERKKYKPYQKSLAKYLRKYKQIYGPFHQIGDILLPADGAKRWRLYQRVARGTGADGYKLTLHRVQDYVLVMGKENTINWKKRNGNSTTR